MIPIPLQQHPDFGAALRKMGTQVRIVSLHDAAPVQVIKRFGLCFVPRGPIWATRPPTDMSTLKGARLHLINSDGGDAALLTRCCFRQVMTPAHVAELPLFPEEARMMQQMQGKWRNVWRSAQETPLKISHGPFHTRQHQWLLDADAAQQKQKRFRALPHAIIAAYPPDKTRVWTAVFKGAPVAGMLFLRHGTCVTYHLGWANAPGRQMCAHHHMLIAAGLHFANEGASRLDLGVVDTQTVSGLARFKIGTGAVVRPLGGSWLRLP